MLKKLVAGLALAALALAPVAPVAAQVSLNLNQPQPTIDTTGAAINPATKEGQASQLTAQQATATNTGTVAGTVTAPGTAASSAQGIQGSPGGLGIDTVVRSASVNRSAVIGFGSTASAASSSSTALTVVVTSNFVNGSGARSGIPFVGQLLTGTGIPAGTTITAVTDNGSNSFALTLSQAATVASGAAVSSGGPQQLAPANLTRRGFSQQNQSTSIDCYQNGVGAVTTGPDSLKLSGQATGTYYESKDSHVGTGAIADQCLSGPVNMYAREW